MTDLRTAHGLPSVLHALACSVPERAAVIHVHSPDADEDGHVEVSYAELDGRARRLAHALRDVVALAPGDRVLLLHPSGIDFPVAFFGCLYAGLVAVPAPVPGANRRERLRLSGIVRQAGIHAVLTDDRNLDAVRSWAESEAPGHVRVLSTSGWPAADQPGVPAVSPPGLGPNSTALVQYTSGSTAEPKGVVISHRNLLYNVATMGEVFALPSGARHGGWIPLYHDMGLVGHLLTGVLLGRGSVLMDPLAFVRRPHHWLRVVDRYDIGHSCAPDFAYDLCVRRVDDEQAAGLDLSRWRYAVNGSEPVRATTLRAFAERFARHGLRADAPAPCYGLAEATLYVSGTTGRRPVTRRLAADDRSGERELVSCGRPHGVDCLIVDPETGTPVPEGRAGEIWLRGPGVGQGYWGDPDATERTFGARVPGAGEQRRLRTGDLGILLDGELFVTGRIKETLLVSGRTVHPQDIEGELRYVHLELAALPGAAFTVPARREGEILVVAHEVRGRLGPEESARLAADMKRTVGREFGVAVGAVALLRRGTVRRTTSGKIQRGVMRELFLAGALRPLFTDEVG
ncbi:MAG: fatty acyl-AMP ligase [Streptomyces sp.]|jgi:acyl-CoA synthetase (AMP-forming)/AMP-acid ligase II|nr:fatty acyl-AMP ligase [Streptomyces sp.]